MISFFFKKSFFDGWDNLLWIVVFNLMFVAIGAGSIYGIQALLSLSPVIGVILLCVVFCVLSIPLFVANEGCGRLVNYKSAPYKETLGTIKNVWKDALLFGVLLAILLFVALVGIPFYFSFGNLIGLFLASIIFWVLLVIVLALQWFLPLYSQLHGGFKKTLKKSFIMLFDNTGFSLILFVYSIVILAFSVVLAFIAPGFVGVCMAQNNALKLRMYKYDWLEDHSEIPKKEASKEIPWDELLDEDREIIGHRTFKNLIFPWKD